MAIRLQNKKPGYSIVEILVAVFVFVTIATTLIYLLLEISTANQQEKYRLTAVALAEEGIEVTRNLRDASWSNMVAGNHGLTKGAASWEFSNDSDTDPTGTFNRQISISSMSDDRVLITSTVIYSFWGLRNISISSSTYLTNWRKVIEPEPPTWEEPEIKAIVGTGYTGNNKNPRDLFISGNYVYMGTEETNAIDPDFFVFDISDPEHPTRAGIYKVGSRVNAVHVSGNYAYLATEKDNAELVVLDISDPANISFVTSADTPRNYDGLGIFVSNGYVYLLTETSTTGNELSIFDATDPEIMPTTPVGTITLGTTPRAIYVNGDLAYIGTSSDSEEVMVVNVEDKAHPEKVGSFNLANSADVFAIEAQGDNLYVGTDVNPNNDPEFYILTINASNPHSVALSIAGSLKVGSRINDLFVNIAGKKVFLATNSGTEEFYVVDITGLANPVRRSALDLPGEAAALDYNGNFVFVADKNNGQELIIIGP